LRNFAKAPKMTIQNVCHKKLCTLTNVKFCMKFKTQVDKRRIFKFDAKCNLWRHFFMASDIQECFGLPKV
jgi:hypothetical protein